jgi:hypothetical protein
MSLKTDCDARHTLVANPVPSLATGKHAFKDVRWIGEMKDKTKAAQPLKDAQLLKRFKLELLDQYVCEKRGYDPYDTSGGRAPDIWSTKRKRA